MNSTFQTMGNQRGAALVITMVVLLVLTMIGIASTDSNQIQSMLVRNNQFRLEAFNTSYSEIDAQIDKVNINTSISAGIPDAIKSLIEGDANTVISSNDTVPDGETGKIVLEVDHPEMDQVISSSYAGHCIKLGFQVDESNKLIDCHLIQLESDAKYKETNVQSNQFQNFEYETFTNNS